MRQDKATTSGPFALAFPAELIDAIADAVTARLAANGLAGAPTSTPYLTVESAAEYIAAKPQRIYDLVNDGRLTPRRDGRRLLFRREDLDAHLEAAA